MRSIHGYGPGLVVLAAALTVLFAGPFALQRLASTKTDLLMVQARNRLDQGDILGAINAAQRDIADFVEPSVVHINAQHEVRDRRGSTPISSGSGWVYDEQGHVVTNYHVVLGAQRAARMSEFEPAMVARESQDHGSRPLARPRERRPG